MIFLWIVSPTGTRQKVIEQWVFLIGDHELIKPMLTQGFPAHEDRTQPFSNPSLRLAFGLLQLLGAYAGQSGIFNFFDSLETHLCQPTFRRLGLRVHK